MDYINRARKAQKAKKIYKCMWTDCKYVTSNVSHLKNHTLIHTGEKPYKCDFGGCDFRCTQVGYLKTHKFTHTGEKPYICDFRGCDFKCTTSHGLTVHKRGHTGEKPYICDFRGCDFKCTSYGGLMRHKRIHTGEKPYICDFRGCDFKCTSSGGLTVHKRGHTGEKPYVCDQCEYRCVTTGYLSKHKLTHTGEKPYKCDICDYRCTTSDRMTVHKRTHTREKPFKCDQCDFVCESSSRLSKHHKTHISIERTRGKPQESRLVERLSEWGYCVDVEVTIDAGKRKCVSDTDRYVSRLDFVILNCTSHILIIECDEEQHRFYELRCELSRMTDVHSALVLAGYTIPIHWIRYSPCGAYHVGDQTRFPRRVDRENILGEYLRQICSGEISPIGEISIHYMFYDRESDSSAPKILSDPDFSSWLKDVVTFQ